MTLPRDTPRAEGSYLRTLAFLTRVTVRSGFGTDDATPCRHAFKIAPWILNPYSISHMNALSSEQRRVYQ